jgi:DNA-binding PadR family transcriptional regulator
MATQHVLLGLLIDQADYGYRLKRRLSPGLEPDRLINDGVLYPLLGRLEREGLLRSRTERVGGRDRRLFRATAHGRRAFLDWLRSDADEDVGPTYELYTSHPLVKLLFPAHLSAAQRRAKLVAHAEREHERLATLERLHASAMAAGPDPLNLAWLELELAQLRTRLDGLRELAGRAK